MNPMRKNKMISFRLSPEEYASFQTACVSKRMRSLSEMARTAVQRMIVLEEGDFSPIDEVRSLQYRIRVISTELDRLAGALDSGRITKTLNIS